MTGACSDGFFVLAVQVAVACDIDLAAYDRPDTTSACDLVELNDAVHHAVVGDGDCGHVIVNCGLHHVFRATGPIMEAVTGMQVQMNEVTIHCRLKRQIRDQATRAALAAFLVLGDVVADRAADYRTGISLQIIHDRFDNRLLQVDLRS